MRRDRMEIEYFANKPWGQAFLREMDLVIAQSELKSMLEGKTLYNAVLNARIADFCAPLDEDLQLNHLGIIKVDRTTFKNYDDFPELRDHIIGRPRGTWAIFNLNGQYDAMMSDGEGSFGTVSGNKFIASGPNGHGLSAREQYGALLSSIAYTRQNQICTRIVQHSAQTADVKIGTVVRDTSLGSKVWSKIELVAEKKNYYVGSSSAFEVKASRRGVSKSFLIEEGTFLRVFGIEPSMPPELVAGDSVDRTISLQENREQAAQAAWDDYAKSLSNPDEYRAGSSASFTVKGSDFVRTVHTGRYPELEDAGEFRVTFAPGRAEVIEAIHIPALAPAPGR